MEKTSRYAGLGLRDRIALRELNRKERIEARRTRTVPPRSKQSLNYPFTHEEVDGLMGYTSSCTKIGTRKNEYGELEQVFAPNRRERRQKLQTRANKAWHGKYVDHWQTVIDKEGNMKRIAHFTK